MIVPVSNVIQHHRRTGRLDQVIERVEPEMNVYLLCSFQVIDLITPYQSLLNGAT